MITKTKSLVITPFSAIPALIHYRILSQKKELVVYVISVLLDNAYK